MTSTTEPADAPTRLTLIRHGESVVTVQRVIGGRRTCRGLSDLGRRQAERLAERLATHGELRPDVLLSSDFPRAAETADIIARALGVGPDFERWSDYGEHDPGPDIDGMTFDDYVERFGAADWHGDPHAQIFPGGETMHEFHARVGRAVDETLRRFAGRHVVVACHGGVVDAVFRRLLGLPASGGFDLWTLNTSITDFVGGAGARWRLATYNDAAHLAGLPTATERTGDPDR